MSTLIEIMPDKPRVSIDSTLMEIMPDKPPHVSVDVNTNGDNARQATREYRCQH